jgi:hypothetical protein
MNDPVFVIHGVGTRDRQAFEARVAGLWEAISRECELKPVYWGDLGADDRWVGLTIPWPGEEGSLQASPNETRDRTGAPEPKGLEADLAVALLAGFPPQAEPMVRDSAAADGAALAAAGAVKRLRPPPDDAMGIRDDDVASPDQAAAVAEAIAEHWESMPWLRQVTDPLLLDEIGGAIGEALADPDTAPGAAAEELRDEEIRAFDVGAFVKRRMTELDRVVGATIGTAAGRLNAYLRTEEGPAMTRFFGDVLVYQRRRKEIHDRVWECVSEVDPGLGRDPDHPVRVIGHSLGGVIAVDIATAEVPLWTRTLVTFGSQSPFFHVCDPRGGQLVPFREGHLVQLPASIGGWTNLWEPMDLLAFIAAKVFRMHDGSAPRDIEVPHLTSSGLWTHSAYWQLKPAVEAIQRALAR